MTLSTLSPTQWQLMRICWDLGGEVTVNQARAEYIRRYAGVRDHRTVGTLLAQCEERGYLESRKQGNRRYYRAVPDRLVTARAQCSRLLDELGDDRLELETLRELIDERLERGAPPRGSSGGPSSS